MATHYRTGRPEQVSAPAMRGIIDLVDRAIENGSLDPQDRDEVIKMFFSDPKLVLDNKAMGGMMNINDMITPVGYKMGTREGNLVGDKEKMMKAGILEDADDLRTMTKRYVLLKSLAESYGGKDVLQRMDDIKEMSPVEIEIEYQKLIGLEES